MPTAIQSKLKLCLSWNPLFYTKDIALVGESDTGVIAVKTQRKGISILLLLMNAGAWEGEGTKKARKEAVLVYVRVQCLPQVYV